LKPDYENTVAVVRETIAEQLSLTDGWRRVVEHLSPEKSVRKKLLALDVLSDAALLESWLRVTLEQYPPGSSVKGLWFALVHPDRDGEASCDLSVVGCGSFDSEDSAWAFDNVYSPQAIPRSEALHELCPISFYAEQNDEALGHICLWYAMLAVAEVCRRCGPIIQHKRRRTGIGVGFGSGDIWAIGNVISSKFVPWTQQPPVTRKRLAKSDYFRLEGNQDCILCRCVTRNVQRGYFEQFGPLPILPIKASVHPDWPNQSGSYGSLCDPGISFDFLRADIANQIATQCPDQVELHPLSIRERPGEWRIFRPLLWIDCHDRTESNRLGRLVLRRHEIAGAGVFCVKGYYEGRAIFVSREIAQLMLDQGITGISYVPVLLK
jgi:hypothetical protein